MYLLKIIKDEKQKKINWSLLKGVNHDFLGTKNTLMPDQKQKMMKKIKKQVS